MSWLKRETRKARDRADAGEECVEVAVLLCATKLLYKIEETSSC